MRYRKNIILIIITFLIFLSCGNDYVLVEIIEQKSDLIINLDYMVITTNDIIDLKYKKKQKIYPKGEIEQIDLSSISQYNIPGYSVGHVPYYSTVERRIVIYFFYVKYGITEINKLDTMLEVKPFDNFNGFYTEYFIYENNRYQVISLKPEIQLGNFVEEFDYEIIKENGISQYKKLGDFIGVEDRNQYIFNNNYIFPEDNNPSYKKY